MAHDVARTKSTALIIDGVLRAGGAANVMLVFTSNGAGAPGNYILLRENGDVQPFPRLSHTLIEHAGGATVDNNAALPVDGA